MATYTPGADPILDAFLVSVEQKQKQLEADRQYAAGQVQDSAKRQGEELGRTADTARVKTGANQRLRGVYRSSTGAEKRQSFEDDVTRTGENIRTNAERSIQELDLGVTNNLADLYAQRETETANSVLRLNEQADRKAALELQRQQAAEEAKRIGEQTQIAQIGPGVNFAELGQPGGTTVDGTYIPPGLDFSGFGAKPAAQTFAKKVTAPKPKPVKPKLGQTGYMKD